MPVKNIFVGTPVSPAVHAYRKAICRACPYRQKATGSCGTLITGATVIHAGHPVKLCGCITNEKSKYQEEGCPAGKW